MRFNRERLRAFVEEALVSNISYLAVRRELYGLFAAALDRGGDVDLANQEFITIRTFLTFRDPKPPGDARLAYVVALVTISELVD